MILTLGIILKKYWISYMQNNKDAPAILNSKFNNQLVISTVLFMSALVIRLLYYYFNTDLTFEMFSISGIPFSDARCWHNLAEDIARGKGLTGVFSALRPFYPILLACFYTWLEPSFALAKIVNIVLDALAVPFVYLIGEKVFNRLIGIFAALSILSSLKHLNYALTLITEPTGFFFFVLSVYYIISGLEYVKNRLFFTGGIFFAISNLTRTLSILAFPGYIAGIVYILKKKRICFKKIVGYAAVFCFGTALCLSPWLIRQKAVHGLVTISGNSADSFYAATSPKFKEWSGEVDRETSEKGLKGIKEKYDWHMKMAVDNIKKYPLLYIRNCSLAFFQYLNALNVKEEKIFYNLSALFVFLLFLSALLQITRKKEIVLSVCLSIFLWLIQYSIPANMSFPIIISGMMLSSVMAEYRYSLILTISLIFTGIGFAVVGGGPLSRLLLVFGWLFQLFYFFTFFIMFQFVFSNFIMKKTGQRVKSADGFSINIYTDKIISLLNLNPQIINGFDPLPKTEPALKKKIGVPSESDTQIRNILKIGASVALFFFAVSGAKLVYLNYFKAPSNEPAVTELTSKQKQDILNITDNLLPGIFSKNELDNEEAFVKPADFNSDAENHNKILVQRGKISKYLYQLTKESRIYHWSRLFYPRAYDRTVFYVDNIGFVLFPAIISDDLTGKDFIFVGKMNVDTKQIYEGRIIVEAVAMMPVGKGNRIDMDNILLAKNKDYPLSEKDRISGDIYYYSITMGINPDKAIGHYYLGILYAKQGNMKESIAHLDQALSIKPDFKDAHTQIGLVFFGQGRTQEAAEHFRKVLKITPDDANAHNNLGVALFYEGDINEAVIRFQEALRIKPDYVGAQENLEEALSQLPKGK
jgi:tetratricopeptide (TPR) repeat protein